MGKKLICTKPGVHGKIWKVGEVAAEETLVSLGGFVPEYFKPLESHDGLEANADNSGTVTRKELMNYLLAKGVDFPANAKKSELQDLMTAIIEKEVSPETPGGIDDIKPE